MKNRIPMNQTTHMASLSRAGQQVRRAYSSTGEHRKQLADASGNGECPGCFLTAAEKYSLSLCLHGVYTGKWFWGRSTEGVSPFALISGRTARAKHGLVEENATGGVYPAATMKRGFARVAAGTHEVRCWTRKNAGGDYPCATINRRTARASLVWWAV